jgi:hypothetical protein
MKVILEKFLASRLFKDAKDFALKNRRLWPYAGAFAACLFLFAFSHARDEVVHVYQSEKSPDFKDARILGSQGDSFYEGKERLLTKTMRELKDAQASLKESNDKLQAKVEELEKARGILSGVPVGSPVNVTSPTPVPSPGTPNSAVPGGPQAILAKDPIRVSAAPSNLTVTQYGGDGAAPGNTSIEKYSAGPRTSVTSTRPREKLGTSIISFPVKDVIVEKSEGVVLPTGSYVKAKLMTGIEAPEGKTYPVLLQLDYAYIVPNHHKLDLTGCFMIAKSQGDLSTERVQMQATKLSCVSKEGRMFERDVNGFIADDKDNSFAVIGSVNSKQDRVAAMGFLSSIVQGVGQAIQQAQTTQQVTPLGGNESMLTGNQMEYIGAGGAANAAGMVTQWYLKQAQNLLPTINVGSGQDIWIVMQEMVKLPNDYFRKNTKGDSSESVYTYFSRIVD